MGRLNFTTTEERLYKEFDVFGQVENVSLVKDKNGKSRGYAFVAFKHSRDAEYAFKKGDGRKIDGRCVLVDRELGRTKRGWYPRRLGGGKGNSRSDPLNEVLLLELEREIQAEEQAEFDRLHGKPDKEMRKANDPDYESGQESEDNRTDRRS